MANKREILAGATDQTIDVFLEDVNGSPLTGLAFNSSGLTCYYRKGATGSATALTLATQTVGGAHSDGGFVQVDATNMPGIYRLDLSDTIVATAGAVYVVINGYAGLAPCVMELEIGRAVASVVGAVGSVTGAVGSVTGAVGSVTGNVGGNVTGSVGSVATGGITAASIATGAIDADALAADAVTEIAAGISVPSAANIATELLDTQEMETNWSMREGWKVLLAIIAGRTSGHPTAPIFRDVNNTKNRVTVTLDDDGNRTAVTTDVT